MPVQKSGIPNRIGRPKIGAQDNALAAGGPHLQDTAAVLNTAADLHPAKGGPGFGQAGCRGCPGPKRLRAGLYRVKRSKRIVPVSRTRLF